MSIPIPVNTPLLKGNELKYLTECIETGWISSEGPFIQRFEEDFSSYIGRSYGVAVSNGSAALDIAVQALDLGPGDEVLVPAFTIISPAQSIVRAGATPVLIDSNMETWNMDISLLEEKINPKTKAIVVVHIYGLPVDMDPVLKLANQYNLKVIEDAAEMHGQTYKNKKCGSFGDISIFSFYPNKHITTGEGGMILCDDPDHAERCRKLRNLAFEPKGRRFVHNELGWNYRMTNLQAALGVAQLEQIDEFLVKKRAIGEFYQRNLNVLRENGFQFPMKATNYSDNIYWVFGLVAPSEKQQNDIVNWLSKDKIATRPFFWCMHEQPVFLNMGLFHNEHYPIAEKMARNGFYLPSGLGMKTDDLQIVVNSIDSFFNHVD